MSNIDYRRLLYKYINHVGEAEGTDFIQDCNDHTKSDIEFSDKEVSILQELRDFGENNE